MDKILIYISTFSPFNNSDNSLLKFLECKKYKKIYLISFKNENSTSYDFLMIKSGIKSQFNDEKFIILRKYFDADSLLNLVISYKLKGHKCDLIIKDYLYSKLCEFNQKEKLFSLVSLYVYSKKEAEKDEKLNYLGITYSTEEEDTRKGKKLNTTYSVLNILAEKRIYYAKELSSMMKEHRYLHSISVAKTCYQIAESNSIDPILMYQAGLFHDCGKDIDKDIQKEIMNDHFPNYKDVPSFAYHQFVGAYLAKVKFGIEDENILNSISYHCTGKGYMDIYQKIVYASDKCEPRREYKTRHLRSACIKNIDDGFVKTIKDQIKYFIKNNIPSCQCELTKEMYDTYIK